MDTRTDLIFQTISTTLNTSSRTPPQNLDQLKQSAGWVLRNQTFRDWQQSGGALLLSGMAGTGKTIICQVVQNYLLSSRPQSETFVLAHYFDFRDRSKDQSFRGILAFIVQQMLKVRPQFQKYYNKLMLTGEGPLEVSDCLRIIHRARQDLQSFYVIFVN